MLANYINEVQNLLNDMQGQFFSLPTLTNYINRSRRRVAAASGCLRLIPVGTWTHKGQEIYPFSDWMPQVQTMMPGVQSILFCRSLAVSFGGKWEGSEIVGGAWKPLWRRLPYTDFAARFRVYNRTFIGAISAPGWYAQLGEGPAGKLYLAPIPGDNFPLEVDLQCIPLPLLTDNDPDPLVYPWTDAVSYFAAWLCLIQQQRKDDAAAMVQVFNAELPFCASVVAPQMITNPYGAVLRSA
jgi:hypothetical protein